MRHKLNNNLNQNQISKLIKINHPFLMVDQIKKLKPAKYGEGIKIINENEWFFKCHLLNEPLMPGTLQIESMLQTIICIIYSDSKKKYGNLLITKSNANFFRKINSAGKLEIKANILDLKKGIIEANAVTKFKGLKASEGKFKFIDPKFFKKKYIVKFK